MVDPYGLILLAFGLPAAIWPVTIARFSERLDAIGSTRRWSQVEPAGWYVLLTRAIGVGMTLLGAIMLVSG